MLFPAIGGVIKTSYIGTPLSRGINIRGETIPKGTICVKTTYTRWLIVDLGSGEIDLLIHPLKQFLNLPKEIRHSALPAIGKSAKNFW